MRSYLKNFLFLLITFLPLTVFCQSVEAVSFTGSDDEIEWLIQNDSDNDSISGDDVGGTKYELYSTAVQVVDDFLIVGIRSNFTMDGAVSEFADDQLVRFSDIILNCIDSAQQQLGQYAIHFDAENESPIETGFYENPKFISAAAENGNQLGSFGGYNDYVTAEGGTPKVGTLNNNSFDGTTHLPNIVIDGDRLGDVFTLSKIQTEDLGLESAFANLPGTTTAIAADISILQAIGVKCSFYLGQECNNDLTGGTFDVEKVPEPTALFAIAGIGAFLLKTRSKRFAA